MEGTQWLNSWSNSMKGSKTDDQSPVYKQTHTESNPMHNLLNNKMPVVQTVPLISPSALSQLQQLYGKKAPSEIPALDEDDNYSGIGTLPAVNMEKHIQLAKEYENQKKAKIREDLKDVSLDWMWETNINRCK